MNLSRDEASATLRDIEAAERRSSAAFNYRISAPHLFLWGAIWVIGYGATAIDPGWAELWPWLSGIGAIASFAIGYAYAPKGRAKRDPRYALTFLAVFAFVGAQIAILEPHDWLQVAAYFPILVALYYALIGIWARAARILLLGIAIFALALGGYFWLPQHFLALMAVAGGGGLVLGGVWLRAA